MPVYCEPPLFAEVKLANFRPEKLLTPEAMVMVELLVSTAKTAVLEAAGWTWKAAVELLVVD
jgi:hypothetical protein